MTSSNEQILGFLTWYSVPAMTISYDKIQALATQAGFDLEFVPKVASDVSQAQGAWKKATNLGARGIVVKPDLETQNQLFKQYGVIPTIRLKVENVRGSRPYLKRQLVAVVTIPNPDSDEGQASTSNATKQLAYKPVCLIEFDTETGMAKWMTLPISDSLVKTVQSKIEETIAKMHTDYKGFKTHCDDQRIRDGIRKWLNSEHSLNARPTSAQGGGGGVYFIPQNLGAEERIQAAQKYITGLNSLALGSDNDAAKAGLQVLPAFKSGSMFSPAFAEEMKEQSIIQLQAEMNALASSISELKASKGKHRANKAAGCMATAKHIKRAVEKYQAAFEDDLEALEINAAKMMKRALDAIDEAQEALGE